MPIQYFVIFILHFFLWALVAPVVRQFFPNATSDAEKMNIDGWCGYVIAAILVVVTILVFGGRKKAYDNAKRVFGNTFKGVALVVVDNYRKYHAFYQQMDVACKPDVVLPARSNFDGDCSLENELGVSAKVVITFTSGKRYFSMLPIPALQSAVEVVEDVTIANIGYPDTVAQMLSWYPHGDDSIIKVVESCLVSRLYRAKSLATFCDVRPFDERLGDPVDRFEAALEECGNALLTNDVVKDPFGVKVTVGKVSGSTSLTRAKAFATE